MKIMEFWTKAKVTEVDVLGEMVGFTDVPMGTLMKVKNLTKGSKALSKLLAYFFVDKSRDTEVITTKEGATNIKGISPSIATMRQQTLESGIEGLQNLITSEESQELLAEIVYYSAPAISEGKSQAAFKEELFSKGPRVVLALLVGVLKANGGALSVLGKLFPQIPTDVVNRMEEALGQED